MFLDYSKNIFLAFLYFLCVAVPATLVYQLARENLSIENVYEHANLVLKPHGLVEQNRYAMREDDGKFLFVAGALSTTKNKLVFHKTSDIRFKVSSLYTGSSCTEAGKHKATLIVRGTPNYVRKLLDKPDAEFTIKVVAGDFLSVKD